jgi:hypothetical protein
MMSGVLRGIPGLSSVAAAIKRADRRTTVDELIVTQCSPFLCEK